MALPRPTLKHASPVSLKQQIVDHITGAVERGELLPGEKLPAGRELAEDKAPEIPLRDGFAGAVGVLGDVDLYGRVLPELRRDALLSRVALRMVLRHS